MTTMSTQPHTCHGAVFCGAPRVQAQAECPACPAPELPPLETEEERLDRIRAAFAALPPATPAPAGAVDRARRVMDTPGWQDRFNTEGLPRGLHDAI